MNLDFSEFLSNSFYITIDPERAGLFDRIFESHGFKPIPRRFYGFTNMDIKKGRYKCMLSHVSVVRMAKCLNLPYCVVYEDDAYPTNGIIDKLREVCSSVPDDAKVIVLGWQRLFGTPEPVSNTFERMTDQNFGSHAYVIFRNAYGEYLEYYSSHTKTASDLILTQFSNGGIYKTRENLFIQYSTGKSISNLQNYLLYHDGRIDHQNPPVGFPRISEFGVKEVDVENDEITKALTSLGKFAYRANGGNLGDCAIACSEYQMMERLSLPYVAITEENKGVVMSKPFNLVYGGGGAWVRCQGYKPILDEFLKNKNIEKCVILPSSFDGCDDVLEALDERFTVFCRDRKSYEYCTSGNRRAKFILHDDMAFSLNLKLLNLSMTIDDIQHPKIRRAFECIEAFLKDHDDFDDANMFRTDCERTSIGIPSDNFDISRQFAMKGTVITRNIAEHCTEVMLHGLIPFDEISTNRLHVAILSSLLGKKVNMYDNSYGKLKNVYEYSLKSKKNIVFHEKP
jgi:hypothetical protein